MSDLDVEVRELSKFAHLKHVMRVVRFALLRHYADLRESTQLSDQQLAEIALLADAYALHQLDALTAPGSPSKADSNPDPAPIR